MIKKKYGLVTKQGWELFLSERKQMLHAYEVAKIHSTFHKVSVYHGNVAEL